MAKKNVTKFASESEAADPNAQATASNGPSAAMVALFSKPAVDMSKFKRLNLPQMIKPVDVPVGGVVCAEIVSVHESPVSTIKGKLLWLRNEEGTEFCFPATGVIRSALAPGIKNEDGDKLQKALEAHIGKTLVAKRLPNKMNKQYGKEQFMFDVFLSAK